jgi:hypothetical protein
MRAPHAYVKYNDFVTFFFRFKNKQFSRSHVQVEPSVASTCMMPQTMRFDAKRCLFGVSLMCACIKGSGIHKKPKNVRFCGNFKPKRKSLITFERKEIDKNFNRPLTVNWGRRINGDVTSGLPQLLVTEIIPGRNLTRHKTLNKSKMVADRQVQHEDTKTVLGRSIE